MKQRSNGRPTLLLTHRKVRLVSSEKKQFAICVKSFSPKFLQKDDERERFTLASSRIVLLTDT
jgi:hypothetical protein